MFVRLISLLCLIFIAFATPARAAETSVYDRVIQSGVLRCGYTLYSIGLMRDVNTGELSGIYKDIIETAARKLNLKVQWVEETGWGQQIEGLNAGRYDLICSPASITGARVREADVSQPLYYSPVWAWVKKGSPLKMTDLNTDRVTLSVMDGEQTQTIAKNYFPKAKSFSLPQTADFSDLMLNVSTGKADATFAEPLPVRAFMKNNPAAVLQKLEAKKPILMVANILLMKRGEPEFKAMIDNILTEMFLSGDIDRAIDRYETFPDSYVRRQVD